MVFVTGGTPQQQRRIERYGPRSWGVCYYDPEDGPFRGPNVGTTRLTPSATTGDITLTASAPFFRPGHVGALFRLTSIGQFVTADLSGDGEYTDPVRVTGVGDQRNFEPSITGTWAGTLTLQRSLSEPGAWIDVNTYTTNGSPSYNDGLDNQIAYYRIGFSSGDYTSGLAAVSLTYASGSLTGVARVTGYTNGTTVSAGVLTALGGTDATEDWEEGTWSGVRGWPTRRHPGRGPPVVGRQGQNHRLRVPTPSRASTTRWRATPARSTAASGPARSTPSTGCSPCNGSWPGARGPSTSSAPPTFGETLTPTNFNIKPTSAQGSAAVAAVRVDSGGVFVQKSGTRLFLLDFDAGSDTYNSVDLTALCPEVGEADITRVAVQRQPDTRIHCVLADGTVAVLVFDKAEDVKCFIEVETLGAVEDAFVRPGTQEDKVYYQVRRTVGGTARRFVERWALESECRGGTLNKQADCFATYSGPASTAITGFDHLEGEDVVVWADGKDFSPLDADGNPTTYTVTGGSITLPQAVTDAVAGLPYEARYKSTKLAYAAALGTALTQRKRVEQLGLILADTHAKGLRYGPSFDVMDDLPEVEQGAVVDPDHV